MRTHSVRMLTLVSTMVTFLCLNAMAATGPSTAWNVFTLPNPHLTPNWRSYAPSSCQSDPDACAQDQRFWQLWNFGNFQNAVDDTFAAVHSMGKYQGVMVILPLGDTAAYWNNIKLMYKSAAGHGVQLQVVVFPKWQFGAEYCYLYRSGAPSGCQVVPGTKTAVAYQKLLKLMKFVQTLNGTCTAAGYHRRLAVWYGWTGFSPGYNRLKDFWQSLPTKEASCGCNLQASYITWLDTSYSGLPEVKQLQNYVVTKLKRSYWVDTELYSTAQLQRHYQTYSPYQTIITGFWGASNATNWGEGMCAKWKTALNPARLGTWTFSDPDLANSESYRAYINGSMAAIGSICTD